MTNHKSHHSEASIPDLQNPFMKSLMAHQVVANVIDIDHYRIRGGLAVETEYIVQVKSTATDTTTPSTLFFESFTMSKTYSSFRILSHQLKKVCENYNSNPGQGLPPEALKLVNYAYLVSQQIDQQKASYLGKVNYMYVKVLAKERQRILNEVLEATCLNFPDQKTLKKHALIQEMATVMETFFLLDHCEAAPVSPNDLHWLTNQHLYQRKTESPPSAAPTTKNVEFNLLNLFKVGSNSGSHVGEPPRRDETAPAPVVPTPRSAVVVPLSFRERRPNQLRLADEKDLAAVGEEPQLMLEDERPHTEFFPSYSRPVPVVRSGGTRLGDWVESNPLVFFLIAAAAIYILHLAAQAKISLDLDLALLVVFASFCLGLHTPRPLVGGFDRPLAIKGTLATTREDRSGRKLLRRSMAAASPHHGPFSPALSVAGAVAAAQELHEELNKQDLVHHVIEEEDEEEGVLIAKSPLPMFPTGAKLGTHKNCWSEPDPADFHVRGAHYLKDKKKIPSGEYLFPCRGMDLFLTDTSPENVGQNPGIMGGRLREVPSFIINFRLPWGIFLLYFKIPDMYIPFIRASYEEDFDKSTLPSLATMSPAERCACRFLMNDMSFKNQTLKIVPVVIDGPWVVRQVVGGKPAIIGNKLPVNYVYHAAEGDKAMYLEADLDIAASSAARGILSVTRSYTQILTLNLGFVVQGNSEDELPEQMLVASRLHGIDPLLAPPYPPMKEVDFVTSTLTDDDAGSVTPVDPNDR